MSVMLPGTAPAYDEPRQTIGLPVVAEVMTEVHHLTRKSLFSRRKSRAVTTMLGDYLLAFDTRVQEEPELITELFSQLLAAGLKYSVENYTHMQIIHITVTNETLEKEAERLQMRKRLYFTHTGSATDLSDSFQQTMKSNKIAAGTVVWAPFKKAWAQKFVGPDGQLFSSAEKRIVIESLLSSQVDLGGLGYNLERVWTQEELKNYLKTKGTGTGGGLTSRSMGRPASGSQHEPSEDSARGKEQQYVAAPGAENRHGPAKGERASPERVPLHPHDHRIVVSREPQPGQGQPPEDAENVDDLESRIDFDEAHDSFLYHLGLVAALSTHSPADTDRLTEMRTLYRALFDYRGDQLRKWVDDVRDYAGNDFGLYFMFLTFYTRSLIFPALLAIPLFAFQVAAGSPDDSRATMIWSLFCLIWFSFVFEFWKRVEMRTRHRWGAAVDSSENHKELEREDFRFTEWRYSPGGTRYKYAPPGRTTMMTWLSYFLLLICCGAVLITDYFLAEYFYIRVLEHDLHLGGEVLASILTAIVIYIFNVIFHPISEFLIWLQNHRTHTQHQRAHSIVLLIFECVNMYGVLFFLAFSQIHAHDPHGTKAVQVELGCVFTLLTTVEQAMEIFKPIVQRVFRGVSSNVSSISLANNEIIKPENEGVFDDFSELVVQFGFIILFAPVFPLAATIALINNVVELKGDSIKCLTLLRRARFGTATDIGIFQGFFDAFVTAAILTNAVLLFFVSGQFENAWMDPNSSYVTFYNINDPTTSPSERWSSLPHWVAFVLMEHAFLLIRYVIKLSISDIPESLRFEIELGETDNKRLFLSTELKLEIAKSRMWDKMSRYRGGSTSATALNGSLKNLTLPESRTPNPLSPVNPERSPVGDGGRPGLVKQNSSFFKNL